MPQAITSTTPVRMAVPRLDSTPEMPTLARMEVRAANTAEPTAQGSQARPPEDAPEAGFRSTIISAPASSSAVPSSFTGRLAVSWNTRMASSTVSTVLDLSTGTTLFTSPMDSALK